jgi:hypothetical protein
MVRDLIILLPQIMEEAKKIQLKSATALASAQKAAHIRSRLPYSGSLLTLLVSQAKSTKLVSDMENMGLEQNQVLCVCVCVCSARLPNVCMCVRASRARVCMSAVLACHRPNVCVCVCVCVCV